MAAQPTYLNLNTPCDSWPSKSNFDISGTLISTQHSPLSLAFGQERSLYALCTSCILFELFFALELYLASFTAFQPGLRGIQGIRSGHIFWAGLHLHGRLSSSSALCGLQCRVVWLEAGRLWIKQEERAYPFFIFSVDM